jgi:hypothetical protein
MNPRIDQPTYCGLCREPFFLGTVTLSNSVGGSWKVAMYGDHPQEAYTGRTWTGVGSVRVMLVRFSLQGVDRFESPRLSDMSNRSFVAFFT